MSGKLANEIAEKHAEDYFTVAPKYRTGSPVRHLERVIAEAIEEGMKACLAECLSVASNPNANAGYIRGGNECARRISDLLEEK